MSLDVYLSCPCCATLLFGANITHNLGAMADAAGLYTAVWRPEEIGIATAAQLVEPLREGIERLRAAPATFRALNPENGWGSYELFLPLLEEYLATCVAHPAALVRVSR